MMRNKALLNQEIVRLHAEDGAFVAALRRRALDGPNYRLIDLYDLENRLRGHLDALVLCGDAGNAAAKEQLSRESAYGEAFVAGYVALQNHDAEGIARLLELAEGSTDCARAVAAAASFCVPAHIAEHVRSWIVGASPASAWIALEICGLCRVDPRDKLLRLMSYPDEGVVARADELAAELGRNDLLPLSLLRIADPGDAGFWAAWAACLLGDRGAGLERLIAALRPGIEPSLARLAAELAPIAATPERARRLVRDLLDHDATRRWAVVALGSIGTAATLDWLVRQMDDPLLARVAGASFALITGGRLGPNNLELDVFPEPPEHAVVAADPQEAFIETNLYWPDRERVGAWLNENRSRFRPDTRHLIGQPAWTHSDPHEPPAKYQLEFRAIAIELALRKSGAPLPNWRAPVILSGGAFTRRW
jgi:uncharacterized protein (TIGR02270 family)